MKRDRLRRALLPTWPPESIAEAMLLLFCAAALNLLLALWLQPGGAVPAQPDVTEAALASLGALARPMALALLLALAARVVLRVAPVLALGLGALLMAGTWVAPLAQGLGGTGPAQAAWLGPLSTALLALPATRLAGRHRLGEIDDTDTRYFRDEYLTPFRHLERRENEIHTLLQRDRKPRHANVRDRQLWRALPDQLLKKRHDAAA